LEQAVMSYRGTDDGTLSLEFQNGARVPAERRSIMIWNVIGNRKQPYRWKRIVAIVEPTWHDNSNEASDEAPEADGESNRAA
jgi:hypothetical protein